MRDLERISNDLVQSPRNGPPNRFRESIPARHAARLSFWCQPGSRPCFNAECWRQATTSGDPRSGGCPWPIGRIIGVLDLLSSRPMDWTLDRRDSNTRDYQDRAGVGLCSGCLFTAPLDSRVVAVWVGTFSRGNAARPSTAASAHPFAGFDVHRIVPRHLELCSHVQYRCGSAGLSECVARLWKYSFGRCGCCRSLGSARTRRVCNKEAVTIHPVRWLWLFALLPLACASNKRAATAPQKLEIVGAWNGRCRCRNQTKFLPLGTKVTPRSSPCRRRKPADEAASRRRLMIPISCVMNVRCFSFAASRIYSALLRGFSGQ